MSKKTTQEKLDTWLQRAGGTFSGLRLMDEFDFDTLPGLFGSVAAIIWSSLEQLEIRSEARDATLLPSIIYKELRLRSLILNIGPLSREFWDDTWAMDVSRMQEFQVETWLGQVPIADSRFTGLVTLRLLDCDVEESALLDVLERNPMLETLGLSGMTRRESRSSRRVELVNLTKLEFSREAYVGDYPQCLSSPHLKALDLDFSTLRSSEAILANTLMHLEELSLRDSSFLSSALITLLRNLRALRKLVFMNDDELDEGVTNSVFEALASPIPGEREGTPPMLCCPRLQHVQLVGDPDLTTESVMGLVKARLPGIRSATASEKSAVRPTPIVYLELEDCPSVNRGSLPWFKANVPTFIYRG